jgi:hypothetical protein
MGAYINPPDMSKEEWLLHYAQAIEHTPEWHECPDGNLPVCLVHNGNWTAAGIAFDEQELKRFQYSGDHREKEWFFAPVRGLLAVSAELRQELKFARRA